MIGSATTIMDSGGGDGEDRGRGGGGTAIVAAPIEEECEDIEVRVGIERTSPPPFGWEKIEAED